MSLVEGLIRKYEGFEINIPRLEIADEGVTALSGPSGAGKTTIFRMLIGLEACPGLKWIFKGEDLAGLPVPERRLGVVFQSLELFPHMTARANILFAAKARGLTPSRFDLLVNNLSLAPILDRPAHVLSGGEAQRVALARALIGEPRFLFLDEPFSSLDADLRREARAMVKSVIQTLSVPTLLITHDQQDLEALANHVVRLKNGHLA